MRNAVLAAMLIGGTLAGCAATDEEVAAPSGVDRPVVPANNPAYKLDGENRCFTTQNGAVVYVDRSLCD